MARALTNRKTSSHKMQTIKIDLASNAVSGLPGTGTTERSVTLATTRWGRKNTDRQQRGRCPAVPRRPEIRTERPEPRGAHHPGWRTVQDLGNMVRNSRQTGRHGGQTRRSGHRVGRWRGRRHYRVRCSVLHAWNPVSAGADNPARTSGRLGWRKDQPSTTGKARISSAHFTSRRR